jgi:hypothetical protein
MELNVEYSPMQVKNAKKPRIDPASKSLAFSVDDTVETFLSSLIRTFDIQDEHLKIIVERDGGMSKLKYGD